MDFTRYLSIEKVDEEQRMVWGYASTAALDLDNEVIKVSAIKNALPDYLEWGNIREMHQPSAVGSAVHTDMQSRGLWLGAHIADDQAWRKCKSTTLADGTVVPPVYKGFSIGGNVVRKVGNTIEELQLIEISIVDRPANPECRIEVVKSAGVVHGGEAELLPALALAKLLEPAISPDSATIEMGAFSRLLKGFGFRLGIQKTGDGFSAPARLATAPPEDTGPTEEEARAEAERLEREGIFPPCPVDTALESEKIWVLSPLGSLPVEKCLWDLPGLVTGLQSASNLQSSLRWESYTEGGDMVDLSMSREAGTVAASIARLIASIASHEAGEIESSARSKAAGADTMSIETLEALVKRLGATGVETILKTASKEQLSHLERAAHHIKGAVTCKSAAMSACKAAHTLCMEYAKKAAAGGKEDFPTAAVAEHMHKAAAHLEQQTDHHEMIDHHVGKAAGNVYTGDATQFTRDNVSAAPVDRTGQELDPTTDNTKAAGMDEKTLERLIDAERRAAKAEGIAEAMGKMPAGVRRGAGFDVSKVTGDIPGSTEAGGKKPLELLMDGVSFSPGADQEESSKAAAKMIGNMIANPTVFAKNPVTDPNFRGLAG